MKKKKWNCAASSMIRMGAVHPWTQHLGRIDHDDLCCWEWSGKRISWRCRCICRLCVLNSIYFYKKKVRCFVCCFLYPPLRCTAMGRITRREIRKKNSSLLLFFSGFFHSLIPIGRPIIQHHDDGDNVGWMADNDGDERAVQQPAPFVVHRLVGLVLLCVKIYMRVCVSAAFHPGDNKTAQGTVSKKRQQLRSSWVLLAWNWQ